MVFSKLSRKGEEKKRYSITNQNRTQTRVRSYSLLAQHLYRNASELDFTCLGIQKTNKKSSSRSLLSTLHISIK